MAIVKADKAMLTTGLSRGSNNQPRQTRTVNVNIGPVRNIHNNVDGATSELYLNDGFERDRQAYNVQRFITGVEEDIATEMGVGYARGAMPLRSSATRWTAATVTAMSSAGDEFSQFPNVSLPSRIQADFEARAITGMKYCASLDPETAASLSQTAAANAFFSTPAGQKGWTGGTLGQGVMFGGFVITRSSNQGVVDFTNANSAITVGTPPVEGGTSMALNITAGNTIRRGDKFSVHNCFSINDMLGTPTGNRAQFTVTNSPATGGTSKSVQFFPEWDSAPRTAADRWRYVSRRPAANDKVYLFEADTAVSQVRAAYNGRSAARSLFFADQTTIFVMVPLRLPTRDREMGKRVTSREAGISFNVVEYFVGDDYDYRTRIDGRWGQKVALPEAGWVVTGAAPAFG